MPDHRPAIGAERLRGLDQHWMHLADRRQYVLQDRKEHRHRHDESDRTLSKPEPEDRERDPGKPRDGLNKVDEGIEEIAARAVQAHQVAQRQRGSHPDQKAEPEAAETDSEIG